MPAVWPGAARAAIRRHQIFSRVRMECGKTCLMSSGIAFPDTGFDAARHRQTLASHARPFATVLVVVVADVIAIFMACAFAFSGWRLVRTDVTIPDFTGVCVTLGLLLLAYAVNGLYAGASLGAVEELRRVALGT